MAVRVKVCGITRSADAQAAIRLGADAIGFVFWQHSTRYIEPAAAAEITATIPPFIAAVGVYVDPDSEWVEESSRIAKLSLLQFHGDETPEFCNRFTLPYIKAVRVKDDTDLLQYAKHYRTAQGILLDTFAAGMPGGTGHTFDWQLIPKQLSLPLILSGGLNPDNVALAIQETQPWAVDVSSGVEATKGVKDEKKIFAFMQGVKQS